MGTSLLRSLGSVFAISLKAWAADQRTTVPADLVFSSSLGTALDALSGSFYATLPITLAVCHLTFLGFTIEVVHYAIDVWQ